MQAVICKRFFQNTTTGKKNCHRNHKFIGFDYQSFWQRKYFQANAFPHREPACAKERHELGKLLYLLERAQPATVLTVRNIQEKSFARLSHLVYAVTDSPALGISAQSLDYDRKLFRRPRVIAIQKRDDLAIALRDAHIERGGLTAVRLAD
jgi:hypothetical protein